MGRLRHGERHHGGFAVAVDDLELSQRPEEIVEVVRTNLTRTCGHSIRVHERAKPGQARAQERVVQEQATQNRVVDLFQRTPELGDRQTTVYAYFGRRVRDLRLEDHEHAPISDRHVVRKDDALLAAMSSVLWREIDAIDDGGGEPSVEVVELLRLEP